jgi:hypothetical protein
MKTLKFSGDIRLDEIFSQHKIEIYNNLLAGVKKDWSNLEVSELTIVNISINLIEYSIKLTRDKFINGLEGAISFYESCEEYEKCADCVSLINTLKNNEVEITV